MSLVTVEQIEQAQAFVEGNAGRVQVVVGQTRHLIADGADLWQAQRREDSRLSRA